MKKTILCMLLMTALLALSACGKNENTAEDAADTSTTELQTVGNDKVGYAELPADWISVEAVNGATALQYASADSKVNLSMDVVDESTLSEEEKESITAESAATGIWGTLEQGGVKQITGAKVKIADYDAFQVYGAYTDTQNNNASSIIVFWVFESDDEVIHVVSVEGAADVITDAVTQVEATYRTTAE